MDILFYILAIYGLFLVPSLLGAGVADAVKGGGTSSMKSEKPVQDAFREIGEKSPEYRRYQKWLEEHQDGVQLPTIDERHAEYMRELAKAAVDREEERRYESWLFDHCEYFKTPKERFEAWVNR